MHWLAVPRAAALAAGPEEFDFALGRVVATPARDERVDFTESYYDVPQAVVARDHSIATLEDLRGRRIGAVGGPSLDAASRVGPATGFASARAALAALRRGRVDAVVLDYPRALELDGVRAVGRLRASGDVHFGLVLAQGSPLWTCVNTAVANVRQQSFDVELAEEWIEPGAPPYLD